MSPSSHTITTFDTTPLGESSDAQDRATTEAPNRDDVAREAYALYEARGNQDGYDVEDWLAAEERLRSGGLDDDRG